MSIGTIVTRGFANGTIGEVVTRGYTAGAELGKGAKRRSTATKKRKPKVIWLEGTEPAPLPPPAPLVAVTVPEPHREPVQPVTVRPRVQKPKKVAVKPEPGPPHVVATLGLAAHEVGQDTAKIAGSASWPPAVASMASREVGEDRAQVTGEVSGLSWEEDDMEILKMVLSEHY